MAAPEMTRGRVFVLDGGDGCGETTQAERLASHLEGQGRRPLHVREPGSTAAGERIRELLLDPEVELGAGAQALLFAAARRQSLEELIEPALAQGRDVVCERFHPSTYAYQGVAGDLPADEVLSLLLGWAGRPSPDLVILLDLDVERARGRRGEGDRFEARDLDFHRRVAEGYRRYAEEVPGAVVVDASGNADQVATRVVEEVTRACS